MRNIAFLICLLPVLVQAGEMTHGCTADGRQDYIITKDLSDIMAYGQNHKSRSRYWTIDRVHRKVDHRLQMTAIWLADNCPVEHTFSGGIKFDIQMRRVSLEQITVVVNLLKEYLAQRIGDKNGALDKVEREALGQNVASAYLLSKGE